MDAILLHPFWFWLTLTGYAALSVYAWRALLVAESNLLFGERVALLGVLLAHALLLHAQMFTPLGMRFGFAFALSVTLWFGAVIYWLESWHYPTPGMRALLFPLAGLSAILPAIFPGALSSGASLSSGLFKLHILIAMGAYSLFTLAALHAILMLLLTRTLHRRVSSKNFLNWFGLNHLLAGLPPLMTLEKLLFRMLGIGFILLTLTLATGIGFSETVFGQAMRFDHKTLFSTLAWIVFGVLLTGRFLAGWRGRLALRYTLAGFGLLLLGYTGSRFVLEVILQRTF